MVMGNWAHHREARTHPWTAIDAWLRRMNSSLFAHQVNIYSDDFSKLAMMQRSVLAI